MSRVTLFVLLIQTLTLTACNENAAPPVAPPPAKVTTARPLVLPVIEWDEYTGRLAAIDAVEVRARVSGYLQSTHFEEGQLKKRRSAGDY
mgnify:CR=1 FL=1